MRRCLVCSALRLNNIAHKIGFNKLNNTLFFTHNAVPSLKLVAPAAIFCGIAGAIAAFQKEKKQSASLKAMPKDKALHEAAWICLLEQALKKHNDNDITYIPKEALVSCQDANSLALQYDLLPAIAKQAISNENRIAQKLHSSIGKSRSNRGFPILTKKLCHFFRNGITF